MDIVTYAAAIKHAKSYTDTATKELAGGLKYMGSVATKDSLPAASSENKGHMYTTADDGHEWVSDGEKWVDLGADIAKLRTDLTTEANARIANDNALDTHITNEKNRAEGIESGLRTDVDSTITRITTIETDYLKTDDKTELQYNINAEKSRAEGIEANLDTEINTIKADYLKAADKAELVTSIATKQDIISDLETIREGAAKGATAIQEHQDISGKVDKELTNANGKAQILNESDGGGVFFTRDAGDRKVFVGVNDSSIGGPDAQVYAIDPSNNNYGAKLDILKDGIYYTVGSDSYATRIVDENKLVVNGDLTTYESRISAIEGKEDGWDAKQDELVSGENIKTVNNTSLLGSGNIQFKTINNESLIVDSATNASNIDLPTKELVNTKQDTLVSGTNIKTINGNSLLGSGNIVVKTFQSFPDDFKRDGTLAEFVSSIESSSGRGAGNAYLGAIENEVCPWGFGNAECKVEYMTDDIALVTCSSSNIAPYYWVMNTWEGTWRGLQGELTAGSNITIENNVISATGGGSSYTAETPIEITDNTIKHKEYFSRDSYAFGIVYYDKYGHITTINGQEVTGGLLHQANKITVNTGKGLEVDSDSNQLKAVGVEYKNNDTIQSNALKFVRLTKTEYDALTAKDADTLYIIIG